MYVLAGVTASAQQNQTVVAAAGQTTRKISL